MNPNLRVPPRIRFADEPPASTEGLPPAGAGRTFTQDDVQAVATREKDQGRRQGRDEALRTLATELGFTTPEEIRTFVEAKRQADAAAMSDAERKATEAQTAKAAADQAKAEAAAATRDAKRTTLLVRAGALDDEDPTKGGNLTDALALLSARVAPDADDATVQAEVAALKVRRPELFAAVVVPARGVDGRPVGGPPAGGHLPPTVPGARGLSEAERRFGARKAATASA